ncbi:hypothetical protein [Rummeliibacillus pycnus]|uniref:hypothetical protein n=1 Tax=Rummeliibacillus pycnus TaxID=101070 RepID=UPI003D2C7925
MYSAFNFEYNDIQNWSIGCSPSNHWRFYYPLRNPDIMDIQEDGGFLHIEAQDQEASDRYYWGVQSITIKRIPLTQVTADNVVEGIFGTFDNF